jgi:LysR family transcriptional activator of nhaA
LERQDQHRAPPAWLNYHHLLYFWTVAREGGLLPAARKLRVTHSTVGAQVHALENALGEKLLVRSGRTLAPTEMGKVVLRYADAIFELGREMIDTVRGRPTGGSMRLAVGIVDVLPKLVAQRVLEPVQQIGQPVRIVCHEDRLDRLLADLGAHDLDVVLSDARPPPSSPIRVFAHELGSSEVSLFAAPALATSIGRSIPAALDGAPMLLPTEGTTLRRSLEEWFRRSGIRPRVVAEVEDSALLKAFGRAGMGVFPAPSVVRDDVCRQYGVREIGKAKGVAEHFFAITTERRLPHPAVRVITERAPTELFARRARSRSHRAP